MLSNRLAFAVLAVACVAAAAGGGYVARLNVKPVAPATAVALPEAPAQAGKPVQETEAVIGDARNGQTSSGQPAAAVEARSAPAVPRAAPSPRRRDDSPRRAATGRAGQSADTTTARRTNQLPVLERSWPSGAAPAQAPAVAPTPPVSVPPVEPPPVPQAVPQIDERTASEPTRAPESPEKKLEELVVSADSVIGLQTETALSSATARVEDRVEARVVRDVRAGGGSVAIPAGSQALGSVMVVEHGGKFKDRARLGIRFHTLVLADGTRVPMTTETIYRYGEAPGNSSATKIGGGALVGAILGAIAGGAKGAAIGATAGADAGTAATAVGDRSTATFPAGAQVTARILSPVTVTIEK